MNDNSLISKNNYNIKSSLRKVIPELFIIPLILGLIIYVVTSNSNLNYEINNHITSFSVLKLGSEQDAVDSSLGAPTYQKEIDRFQVCTYLSDYYAVQTAYDTSGVLKAYLITEIKDLHSPIHTDVDTLPTVEGFHLGTDSFYDYPGKPAMVQGYVSQGIARSFYGEQYCSASGENHWLLSVDFGHLGMSLQKFILMIQLGVENVDDEVDSSVVASPQTLTNRKKVIPNTYGCSVENLSLKEMEKLFFFYNGFDSLSLREHNIV